ncbi:MAG: hypothetical protein QOE58_3188 [Actinomycetota bacterium]|jgi:hypothetical protein|nr:hypothetical protein [Actinomycetota bacterium]
MPKKSSWVVGALTVAVLGLTGCAAKVAAEETPEVAVKVQPIAGTDRSTVTLTPTAIARIGLETEKVRPAPAGHVGVVSYGAVLYDAAGATWVYTSPAARSFMRRPVVVDRVDGDVAYLKKGPKVGTTVVKVGVPELFGAEYGVGGE